MYSEMFILGDSLQAFVHRCLLFNGVRQVFGGPDNYRIDDNITDNNSYRL